MTLGRVTGTIPKIRKHSVELSKMGKEIEAVDIGHVRVYTRSVLKAAKIAAKVKRTRQKGTIDGIKYECLAIARERG